MKKVWIIGFLLLLSHPVFAGTYMFKSRPSVIHEWLGAKGYGGSVYDGLNQYFSERTTLSNGTLYDNVMNVLGQAGCDGTMQDRLNCLFNIYGGEDAFWSNSSNDFLVSSGGNYLTDPDGNTLTDPDGNNLLNGDGTI